MAPKKIQLTKEGLAQILEELRILKDEKRAEVAEKLKEAISFGDLSENAEYEAAREQQAQIEHRIFELEEIVKNHEIIDDARQKKKNVVSIGSRVTLSLTSEGRTAEDEVFKIVGSTESNIMENNLSNESPVGSAIMGRAVGETVTAKAPSGTIEVKIVSIAA